MEMTVANSLKALVFLALELAEPRKNAGGVDADGPLPQRKKVA